MSTEPKFYAVDALNAYPEPVGTDDKLELNLDMGAVYIHLNYKRAKLVGLQSLDFLISQLEVIRTEALGARNAAPVVERQEPVATVKENPYCPEGMSDEISVYLPVGTKLYAEQPAPQVHEWDINDHGTATVCSICGVRSSDEQPAPVAVAILGLDIFKALEKVRGGPVLTTNQCYDLARELNACLDKVKELNQSSTIAGFKVVEDPAIQPNEVRICSCNQGRLPCSCKG